jgi:hypothetical protein
LNYCNSGPKIEETAGRLTYAVKRFGELCDLFRSPAEHRHLAKKHNVPTEIDDLPRRFLAADPRRRDLGLGGHYVTRIVLATGFKASKMVDQKLIVIKN